MSKYILKAAFAAFAFLSALTLLGCRPHADRLIVVNKELYSILELKRKLDDLKRDWEAENAKNVKIVPFEFDASPYASLNEGGAGAEIARVQQDASRLRKFIKKYRGLKGVLLVGDMPVAIIKSRAHSDEWYVSDYYFMDMNEEWENDAGTNYFIPGQQVSDIIIGRLMPGARVGIDACDREECLGMRPVSEVSQEEREQDKKEEIKRRKAWLIKNYLDKIHAYRAGNLTLAPKALQVNDLEAPNDLRNRALRSIYFNIDSYDWISKNEYITLLRAKEGHEWLTLWAHSSPVGHEWQDCQSCPVNYFNAKEYMDRSPRINFYLFQGCSACSLIARTEMDGLGRFRFEPDSVCANALFAKSHGIAVVGPTMPGTVTEEAIYKYLRRGVSIGEALREAFTWWVREASNIDLQYMVLQGDPFLTPRTSFVDVCVRDNETDNCVPPLVASQTYRRQSPDITMEQSEISVRVHNRGKVVAGSVIVKLLWAFAPPIPDLPEDFWENFPGDSSDSANKWYPIDEIKHIRRLEWDRPQTVKFTWSSHQAQQGDSNKAVLLAVIRGTGDTDEVKNTSQPLTELIATQNNMAMKLVQSGKK